MRFDRRITAVDIHADGMPGRVITGGVPDVPGSTMLEKARYLEAHGDDLRKLMLNEPRGYPASCCNLILPSNNPAADHGYVIMEHVEYPAMSGSNTICVATVLIETGMVEVTEPITRFTLEAPAGLIDITATVKDGKATSITFRNVPAFVAHLGVPVEIPSVGTVTTDIAWGGMFYAIADASAFGLELTPDEGSDIVRFGSMLTLAASEQYPVHHPLDPSLAGVTISQLSAPPRSSANDRRNAVTMGTGWPSWDAPGSFTGCLDRSPCGTGTSATLACLAARGRLAPDTPWRQESVIGSVFEASYLAAPEGGVLPIITGRAWITGEGTLIVDSADPYRHGIPVAQRAQGARTP
jgi:proline racemase